MRVTVYGSNRMLSKYDYRFNIKALKKSIKINYLRSVLAETKIKISGSTSLIYTYDDLGISPNDRILTSSNKKLCLLADRGVINITKYPFKICKLGWKQAFIKPYKEYRE